jgi:hypothetical protein
VFDPPGRRAVIEQQHVIGVRPSCATLHDEHVGPAPAVDVADREAVPGVEPLAQHGSTEPAGRNPQSDRQVMARDHGEVERTVAVEVGEARPHHRPVGDAEARRHVDEPA